MASPMDVIYEAINKLHQDLTSTQHISMDEGHIDSVNDKVYDALKAIPNLNEDTMLQEFDIFLLESTRAKGFLRMSEAERVKYI